MPVSDELLLKMSEQGSDAIAKDLNNVADSVDNVTKSTDKLADSADKSSSGFKGMKIGLADLKAGLDMAGNAIGKVTDFVKDAVEGTMKYAAEVRDLSRAIGANAEEASSLIQVADDVNVSVGTLEAAFKAAIKNGIQPNISTLAKLSDEYNAIQDPIQRSQFAMQKFGRAGLEMGKLLEQGGDAIKAAAREAKNLGLTLDDKAVKAARDLEINMDNLGDKLEAFKTKVGNAVIPVLNDAANTLDLITDGSNHMSDAFLASQEKMFAEVVAGKMSIEDYNNAVIGMTNSIMQWDAATGRALQNQYLTSEAQVQEAAATKAASDAIIKQNEDIKNNMIESGNAQLDAIMRVNQAHVDEAAAIDKAAAADAAYRANVGETITRVDSLAKSLANATDAQAKQMLAQSALDVILKAQEAGRISSEEAIKATDAVMIKYGLATEKSVAMSKAQEEINNQFLAGKLPLDKYIEDIDKLPKIANDGKIDMVELRQLGISPTTAATVEQTGKVDLLADAWRNVPAIVRTQYIVEQTGEIPQPPSTPGRAFGGPVTAGLPYMVGERGPEMFVPSQNGTIISNNTSTHNYNITTDRTGLAYMFERQRMAESRM